MARGSTPQPQFQRATQRSLPPMRCCCPPHAPVARQKRRRSNLEGIFTAIMPCFSMKCSAISPKAWCPTTTRAPLSAMALMTSSIRPSSLRL